MYVQGDDRIFGMDAYNGSILWTVEIPELIRTNVKSDSTNLVCDDKNLYAAVAHRPRARTSEPSDRHRAVDELVAA